MPSTKSKVINREMKENFSEEANRHVGGQVHNPQCDTQDRQLSNSEALSG